MRKVLLFVFAFFSTISLFSQELDVYYEPFSDSVIPFRWKMSNRWDSLTGMTDWIFAGGATFSYAGKEGLSETYLMSPGFRLSKGNADGEMSFTAFSHPLDSLSDSTISWFGLGISIDDDSVFRYGDIIYLSSKDSVQTYKFRLGDMLNLGNEAHFYTFIIYHYGQHGDAGALFIDNFVLRKRPDVYYMYFMPGEGEGESFYNVAYKNDTFITPPNRFDPPEGKRFSYWFTWDVDGTYGILEKEQVWDIEQDLYWMAVYGDPFVVHFDANGGGGTMVADTGVQYRAYYVPANGFYRAGYRFSHWNTKADGTGESYYLGDKFYNLDTIVNPGDTVASYELIATDITLYAQWDSVGSGQGSGGEVNPPDGIADVAMECVSLYPNPAQTTASVLGVSSARLELTDLAGRTIRSVQQGNTINLDGLDKGVYLLRIHVGGSTAIRKIVKH